MREAGDVLIKAPDVVSMVSAAVLAAAGNDNRRKNIRIFMD